MDSETMSGLHVLHVDHSSAPGGAELALRRILSTPHAWVASVALPPSTEGFGVFSKLAESKEVSVSLIGPVQVPGASKTGILRSLVFAASALGQALALRRSSSFRSSSVIHANSSRAALYSAVACIGSDKSLVVHLRDRVDRESFGRIGLILFRAFALRRADAIIASSNSVRDSAEVVLTRRNIPSFVIPSASGLELDTSGGSVAEEVQRVGMVARLDPWKGQDLLLRAFARVFRGSEVRLVLAGAPLFGKEDYLDQLRSLAGDLSVTEQVDFLGHVDDIAGLIASLDICVQTSLRPEPLGQNVLQYLALGRPTIATNAGGPAEWIVDEDNGLLFEIGNETQLAGALARLAGDRELRQQLGAAAAKTEGLLTDQEVAVAHAQAFWSASSTRKQGIKLSRRRTRR